MVVAVVPAATLGSVMGSRHSGVMGWIIAVVMVSSSPARSLGPARLLSYRWRPQREDNSWEKKPHEL